MLRFLSKTSPANDGARFPLMQLLLLSLVRVSEPIAITSTFPYAWQLILHYDVGDRSNASFYSGLFISAFAFSECLSGFFWGALSDRIGRKPCLLTGCAGTALSLLVVGFAPNFWVALLGRVLGGLLNGNMGVCQTMVGELVKRPEHEPRAFSILPFVWSIGTVIGPSIGGYFANPAANFPTIFPSDGLFARYPYLLPNLICAVLLMVGVLVGLLFLNETHPDMQKDDTSDWWDADAETPLLFEPKPDLEVIVEPSRSYGACRTALTVDADSSSSITKAFTPRVITLIACLGLFVYHSMTFDVLFPILLQDERATLLAGGAHRAALAGGLGMSMQEVGVILSINGFIALFTQGVIFPFMASWLGVWKLFFFVTLGHPVVYMIIPYLVCLPHGMVLPGIYFCLALRGFFAILLYPVLLILIKEASPSASSLGKINGLAASVGAACRMLASPVAGFLYGVGLHIGFTPLSWWTSAGIAMIGAVQVFWIRRQRMHAARLLACAIVDEGNRTVYILPKDTARVQVAEVVLSDSDSESDAECEGQDGCRRQY